MTPKSLLQAKEGLDGHGISNMGNTAGEAGSIGNGWLEEEGEWDILR